MNEYFSVILLASANGWWGRISDTKKGIAALVSALALGFTVGAFSMTQVGIPSRVQALEVETNTLSRRVSALENMGESAQRERRLIGQILNWQTCAIGSVATDSNPTATCGRAPQYIFGEQP